MACKCVAYLVLLLLISSVASDRPEIKEEDPVSHYDVQGENLDSPFQHDTKPKKAKSDKKTKKAKSGFTKNIGHLYNKFKSKIFGTKKGGEASDKPEPQNGDVVADPDDKKIVKLMICRPDLKDENKRTEYNKVAQRVFDTVTSNTHQFFQLYTLLRNTDGTFVLLEVFADETASNKHLEHHETILNEYKKAREAAGCGHGLSLRKKAGSDVLSVTGEKHISHLRYVPVDLTTLKDVLNDKFGVETWILFAVDHVPGHYELFILSEKKDTFKNNLNFLLQDDKNVDENLVAMET